MLYITICSHCSRIKAPGTETWLNLFLRPYNSLEGMISHGLCLDCLLTNPEYERIRDRVLARMQERERVAVSAE